MEIKNNFDEFLEVYSIDTEFYFDDVEDLLPDGSELYQPAWMLKSYSLLKDKTFKGFRGRDYEKIVKLTDKDYDSLGDDNLKKYLSNFKKMTLKEKLSNDRMSVIRTYYHADYEWVFNGCVDEFEENEITFKAKWK